MRLRELLAWGRQVLKEAGIEDWSTDAWYCFEYVFGISRACYYQRLNDIIEDSRQKRYEDLIARRASRIPVQQLLGEAWFYGYPFFVNEQVLIPRQDTEVLVEEARKRARPGDAVLDLCTGSGCVLLALMKSCAGLAGTGADLSEAALEAARENGRRLGIEAEWLKSDLFASVQGVYDLITSNPPYISSGVIPTLMEEVRDHEPRMALDGGEDGLDFYRRITAQAGTFLKEGGWLCLEIGYDQGSALEELLRAAGYEEIEIVRDLSGLDRVAVGRRSRGGNHV